MKGHAEVHLFAHAPLQFGKQPGNGLHVLPDVSAGAVAAADSFPAIETPVGETDTRHGGQHGRVAHHSVQQPVGQSAVVPGVVPQFGLPVQHVQVLDQVQRDIAGGAKSPGVVLTYLSQLGQVQIGEMPGYHEGENRLLPWC